LTLTTVLAERMALSVHGLLSNQAHAVRMCPEPVEGYSRASTLGRAIVLVPIPSAPATVRRRGFDATASMARLAARRLQSRYPVTVWSALAQARRVADQAGLGARARQENLAGAYRLRKPISAAAAVLVDDVVTTGSSLTEAARALRAAGIIVLGAATVAATMRLRPGELASHQADVRGLRTQ
jgi:predicted amidophosphoribosyltransferase